MPTYVVGFVLMLLLTLFRCKAYGVSRRRAAVYTVLTFGSGFAGALLAGAVCNFLFSLKGVETDVKVDMLGAVILTAVFLPVAVNIEKPVRRRLYGPSGADGVSMRNTMDLMIPGSFLVFACVKVGCHVRGCCLGVECSWGITSPVLQKTVFPVQLFESISVCVIIILCYYIKRTAFYRRGMGGPLAAGFYGVARFFWEFFRYYTPEMRRFALGLTLWQLFSVLVIVVAAVWTAVLYKTQPSAPLRTREKQIPAAGRNRGNKKKSAGGHGGKRRR